MSKNSLVKDLNIRDSLKKILNILCYEFSVDLILQWYTCRPAKSKCLSSPCIQFVLCAVAPLHM